MTKDTLLRWWCTYFRHTRKNSKITYYIKAYLRTLAPHWWCEMKRKRMMKWFDSLQASEQSHIIERVDYYCRPALPATIPDDAPTIGELSYSSRRNFNGSRMNSVYFFDAHEYVRCFPQHLRWLFFGGDCDYTFPQPVISKARSIHPATEPDNNTLLNMDKVRHFTWIYDPYHWEQKQCTILFRGDARGKVERQRFIDMWKEHPWCDLVSTGHMSIFDHLHYRYIMCLEGYDVASNLKWVMSSNSVAVMPRPTCETWFMEGRLIPNYHYIEIADDYHDLIDRITYYEEHPDEAKAIVEHAHEWVKQFQDKKREDLISLMVLAKYFHQTGQEI